MLTPSLTFRVHCAFDQVLCVRNCVEDVLAVLGQCDSAL